MSTNNGLAPSRVIEETVEKKVNGVVITASVLFSLRADARDRREGRITPDVDDADSMDDAGGVDPDRHPTR